MFFRRYPRYDLQCAPALDIAFEGGQHCDAPFGKLRAGDDCGIDAAQVGPTKVDHRDVGFVEEVMPEGRVADHPPQTSLVPPRSYRADCGTG